MMQLNQTLHHVTLAMYEFNRHPNKHCYPGFSHNDLSDVLLKARSLLHSYTEHRIAWCEYKQQMP